MAWMIIGNPSEAGKPASREHGWKQNERIQETGGGQKGRGRAGGEVRQGVAVVYHDCGVL